MILIVFLNEHDKNSYVLGRTLPDHLKGDYVKIYTRYDDVEHEKCEVKDTLKKIKEYALVFDKVIISFGLRIFPPTAYKELLLKHSKSKGSMVFLKKLKGSKTWTVDKNNKVTFDNYRIADTGLFILDANDIKATNTDNFNTFLKELIENEKLSFEFVPFWIFTNKNPKKPTLRKRS